jgi:hypothetical protein
MLAVFYLEVWFAAGVLSATFPRSPTVQEAVLCTYIFCAYSSKCWNRRIQPWLFFHITTWKWNTIWFSCYVFVKEEIKKGQVKVKSLCLTYVPQHEVVLGSGGVAPHILNLDTRWMCVVIFTSRPFYSRGRNPCTRWVWGWVGPRTCLDAVAMRKKSQLLPCIDPRSSSP